MSRIRLFILLAVSFLMASAALADDLAYVDCASHPESTQIFSKARQTPDSLGTVACGERFTVLVYGFVFSRVQTKDGKVGYVYSNLITVDRGAASQAPIVPNAPAAVPVKPVVANASVNAPAYAQPASAAQAASMPVTTSAPPEKPAAPSGPLFPTPPMPAVTAADMASSSAKSAPASSASAQPAPAATTPAQPASSPAPAASIQPAASAASRPGATTSVETSSAAKSSSAPSPAPAPVTPSASSAPASAPAALATAPSVQPAAPAPSQPSGPAPAETQPAASPAPAQSSASAQPGPLFPAPPPPPPSSASDSSSSAASAAADPGPAAASQPQPESSQPAAEPIRSASARSSWEQPTAGVRQNFLVQLYGGYAFDRFTSGGVATNLSGGMGSFGYNLKPWLQIVGDSSYSYVTGAGVKNVLYGNHFGGRFFYHPGRWRVTPFAEALVGGSRFDITVSGPGGYKASQNCISYKAGGGLDFRISRRWEVRVIDVDYYRTSFGTGSYPSQSNYWASAGVVMRLFGSGASE